MGIRTTGKKPERAGAHEPSPPEPLTRSVVIAHDRVTVHPTGAPLRLKTPTQSFRADATIPDPHAFLAVAPTDPLAVPLHPPAPIPVPAVTSIPTPTPTAAPASAPPRAIVYPLVSVIAADGEIHPKERELIDRFLQSEGLAPLGEDEFKVHHPSAVAHLVPRERREMVVQLMCETATVDGMPDESERRVIRAYAAAWDVPDDKVDFWMWGYENMSTSLTRQLWMKLRRFVLSARWSDGAEEGR
jgi:uncharacterized tellurite resistance protein B-like protein